MRARKTWVLILKDNGHITAWRDYGNVAWGSPEYTVLGYHEGTYRDAMIMAHSIADSRH